MFFVGAVFSLAAFLLFYPMWIDIDFNSTFFVFIGNWQVVVAGILVISMYGIGFILNRASSIIVSPLLEKTKIWPRAPYSKDVSEISQDNQKFQSMITELVLMRTHILIYSLLTVLALFSPNVWIAPICEVIVVIFILSGRKHNSRINIIRGVTGSDK